MPNDDMNCDGGLPIEEKSNEGDNDKNMPHAPTTTSTTSQSFPPQRSNINSTNPCREMIVDDVGMDGKTLADVDWKVKCVREHNCVGEKVVKGVMYLELGQVTRAQLCLMKGWANEMFDALWGYVILVILRHVVCDRYTVGGAVVTEDYGDGLIRICAISSFDNYVGGLEDDHINSTSIMSSGESMKSTTLGAEHLHHVAAEENLVVFMGTQTCEELLLCNRSIIIHIYPCDSNTASSGIDKYVGCNTECDDDTTLPIIVRDNAPCNRHDDNVFASYEASINDDTATVYGNDNNKRGVLHYGTCEDNLTWIGNCRMTQNRGESGYGENKGGDVKTYAVYIILDNVSERKSDEIANIISVEVGM